MAHAAANALNHDLCHCCFLVSIIWQNARKLKIPGHSVRCCYSLIRPAACRACSIFALWASLGSTRGRRHSPAFQPSTFMAYLTTSYRPSVPLLFRRILGTDGSRRQGCHASRHRRHRPGELPRIGWRHSLLAHLALHQERACSSTQSLGLFCEFCCFRLILFVFSQFLKCSCLCST